MDRSIKKHKGQLDILSIQLDGTHTPTKRGSQAVDYPKRKNVIPVIKQGVPITCSDAIAGNNNDMYELTKNVKLMFASLEKSTMLNRWIIFKRICCGV